jgi:hypothetical protein
LEPPFTTGGKLAISYESCYIEAQNVCQKSGAKMKSTLKRVLGLYVVVAIITMIEPPNVG